MIKRISEIKTMGEVVISDSNIFTLEEYVAVVRFGARLEFGKEFCDRVKRGRELVDEFLHEGRIIYGVTTGFGENVRYTIAPEEAEKLQKNIVRSHACAVGEPLTEEQARGVMLMTILNSGQGHTGIRLETLELIKNMLNNNIYPYAPSEGSVGYLGVEAHLAMAYIGEGEIFDGEQKLSAKTVLEKYNLTPLTLQCKEGLSMLNGSISVTALSLIVLFDSIVSMKNLEVGGALCYEALRGTIKALDPRIHSAKAHVEQQNSAANLRKMLEGSEISDKYKDTKVQDAYLLRAMPQIHSSAYRLVKDSYSAIIEEMHSCSDNPEIFDTEDGRGDALMCGNFDGTLIGSHVDMIGMAAAIAGNEAERCINRMLDRNLNDGLPAFLVNNPGINNGYMIPQYTAAGLLNEIKLLAIPATIDSISTCASQEDPVSMAYNSAKRAAKAIDKLQYIIAIDIMVALQAIDMLRPLKQSYATAKIHDFIRKDVPFLDEDRFIHPEMEHIKKLVKNGDIVELMESIIGEIKL